LKFPEYFRKIRLKNMILLFEGSTLLLMMAIALTVGPVKISFKEIYEIIWKIIFNDHHIFVNNKLFSHAVIITQVRLPRIILSVLVGISLASSGMTLQALFRNPLASPYILGISSGAAFGGAFAILMGFKKAIFFPIFSLSFAFFTTFLVYKLSQRDKTIIVGNLLLSGVAIAAFFSAMLSFSLYLAGEKLYQIIFWLMGGFWLSNWNKLFILFPMVILGITGLFFFYKEMNLLLLGDRTAMDLGVDVERTKKILLFLTSLLTSGAVCMSGMIGFVGLIVPHMMRLLIGPDHRYLLPASCIGGGLLLLFVDTFARSIITPVEVPVGVFTALIGAPFFLFLLKQQRNSQ